jgi:alpha-amylase
VPRRLRLGLVLHNHQPVGNYGFVIEQVYHQAYEPMLAALERHPYVNVALHTSGCLFDWIAPNRPEYVQRLRRLVARGQVELLTGGYYEPILPAIPDVDKRGQITKLTAYLERTFGQRPAGLWLTERVWEPSLPAPLADAGVRWTLVDDAHFHMAGLTDDALDGYYLTEDQGRPLALFAGSQRLRYVIPWSDVDDVISELRQLAEHARHDNAYIVLGDDGEKFGAWPTTYDHVWTDGWVERFFSALGRERDWLEVVTPGVYMREHTARGLVYLPTASYAEMMEWALPAEASARFHALRARAEHDHAPELPFLRGGFWRMFLPKYPESNAMHKRALRIGERLAEADAPEAREALWAGECNCPYWHGVFGGLYLRHIRAANNSNLVRAERLADEHAGGCGIRAEQRDFDLDGEDELLVQTPALSLLLHPAHGGMLSELDARERDWALLDVLARRREAYHQALLDDTAVAAGAGTENIHGAIRTKQQGLRDLLALDRYRRGGLQEWLLAPEATVEQFARDTAETSWEPEGRWSLTLDPPHEGTRIALAREAGGWRVAKTITIPPDDAAFVVEYAVTNAAASPRTARFVSEWNLSPPQSPAGDDRTALLDVGGATLDLTAGPRAADAARTATLRGSAAWGARFTLDVPCDLWTFPVQTVSSSEGGIELVTQGFSLSFTHPFTLAPGETASLRLTLALVDLPPDDVVLG